VHCLLNYIPFCHSLSPFLSFSLLPSFSSSLTPSHPPSFPSLLPLLPSPPSLPPIPPSLPHSSSRLTTPTSSTSDSQHNYTKEGKLLLTLIEVSLCVCHIPMVTCKRCSNHSFLCPKDGEKRSGLGLGTYVMILRGLVSVGLIPRHLGIRLGLGSLHSW